MVVGIRSWFNLGISKSGDMSRDTFRPLFRRGLAALTAPAPISGPFDSPVISGLVVDLVPVWAYLGPAGGMGPAPARHILCVLFSIVGIAGWSFVNTKSTQLQIVCLLTMPSPPPP
jgi:hypothetical protein